MILRSEDMFGPADDPFDPEIHGSGQERELVVWVDRQSDLVALLRVGEDWPRWERLAETEARIDRQNMIVEPAARMDPPWLDKMLDEKDRTRRDERMAVIRPLLDARIDILDRVKRGRMIGARSRETGRARNSIKRWLVLWFGNGRCSNALLDRYEGSGHRRRGQVADGWKKLGRPSSTPGLARENVSTSIMEEFALATERERRFAPETFRISGAYRRWKNEFCHVEVEIDGRLTARLADRYADRQPASYDQFLNWYINTRQHEKTSRIALGEPIYAKDNRAIVSTSTMEAGGPGSRFQIDATVVNFPLSSSIRKNVLLGRPYLYFVRDVWSRIICGYYIGFEPPSELAAAMALLNAFTPKDALLRRFGFDPEDEPWPVHHVCGALLHDGGELTGHQGDWLVNRLRIAFEQTSAERGDLKGAVETLFHWSDVDWSRTTKGRSSSPRYRPKSRRPDDLAAAAAGELDTEHEFERKVIAFILRFNNHHVLNGYDSDQDMLAAGIPRVPLDMFRWGCANRGAPRVYDPEQVRFNLMPRKKVSVDRSGILFRDRCYTQPFLFPLQAEAARTGRRIRGTISFDHLCDEVLWHDKDAPHGFRTVGLADSHRSLQGLRFEDADTVEDERASEEAKRRAEEDRRIAAESYQRTHGKVEATPMPDTSFSTRAEAKAASGAARKAAREAGRLKAFEIDSRSGPSGPERSCGPERPSATIHPFPGSSNDKYAPPGLEEFDQDG